MEGLCGGNGEGRVRTHVFVINYKVEKKDKIYIQVNQTSFSPNGAVVTHADSGWVSPGSNPCSMDKIKMKLNEVQEAKVQLPISIKKN